MYPDIEQDLHLFLDDEEIVTSVDLTRVVQPLRRECLEPIVA